MSTDYYQQLVQLVLERNEVKIASPIAYGSIRRGVNKVMDSLKVTAEFDGEIFQGHVTVKQLDGKTSEGNYKYLLTFHPDGKPLADMFKPRFEFELLGDEDEQPDPTLCQSLGVTKD